jgi:hypothetical protein
VPAKTIAKAVDTRYPPKRAEYTVCEVVAIIDYRGIHHQTTLNIKAIMIITMNIFMVPFMNTGITLRA